MPFWGHWGAQFLPPLSHSLPGAAVLSLLMTRSSHSLSGQEVWTFWPACHPTYVVPKPSLVLVAYAHSTGFLLLSFLFWLLGSLSLSKCGLSTAILATTKTPQWSTAQTSAIISLGLASSDTPANKCSYCVFYGILRALQPKAFEGRKEGRKKMPG